MTTKRCLLFLGLLIAVAFLGLYAAKPTSALASETTVAEQDACQPEGGDTPEVPLTPANHSCNHCTTTQDCITLGCGGDECDPVCVPWGAGKRCLCM